MDNISTTSKPRLGYVDVIRGICIILLCRVHVFGIAGLGADSVDNWHALFALPIFFVSNGYTLAPKFYDIETASFDKNRKPNFGEFIKKRANSLLWPYLTFSIPALAVRFLQYRNWNMLTTDIAWEWICTTITGAGLGALWFLPALFVTDVLVYLLLTNKRAPYYMLAISIAAAFSCRYYNSAVASWTATMPALKNVTDVLMRGIVGIGFVAIGILLRNSELYYKRLKTVYKALILCGCLAITLIAFRFTGYAFVTLQFNAGFIWIYIDNIVATWLLLRVFEAAEEKKRGAFAKALNYLESTGRDSLIIMATHMDWYIAPIVFRGIEYIFGSVDTTGPHYSIRCLAVLVVLMITEYGLCKLIRSGAPWMLKLTGAKSRQ